MGRPAKAVQKTDLDQLEDEFESKTKGEQLTTAEVRTGPQLKHVFRTIGMTPDYSIKKIFTSMDVENHLASIIGYKARSEHLIRSYKEEDSGEQVYEMLYILEAE